MQSSQFRHLDHQHGGGNRRDTWNGDAYGPARGKGRIGADLCGDSGIDGGELLIDLLQPRSIVRSETRKRDHLGAVLCGRAILDKGFAGEVQILEGIEDCIPNRRKRCANPTFCLMM